MCISLDVNFNESLTNDLVSFEQLGPGWQQSFVEIDHHSDMHPTYPPRAAEKRVFSNFSAYGIYVASKQIEVQIKTA